MSGTEARPSGMWKRLLWREYREGRAALLLAFLIPPLMFWLADRSQVLHEFLRAVGILSVHLVILFWAIARGDRKLGSSDFELAHLPAGPISALTASFAVPVLASALVGAAYGWWLPRALGPAFVWWSPWNSGFVLAGAIDVMTTYAFGYYFAAVISRWLAVLVGVIAILAAKLISVGSTHLVTRDVDAMVVAVSCAVGAAVGLLVFTKLIGRKPLAYRQAVSLGIMAFFGLFPGLWTFDPTVISWTLGRYSPKPYSAYAASDYFDPRTRVSVWATPRPGGNVTLLFQRDPEKPAVAVEIDGMIKTIGVVDRRYVYLAQQFPGSGIVKIIVWDTPYWQRRGRVRELARFRAREMAIGSERGIDAVSPDCSYALLTLNALIGEGEDNWIVNLKTGKAAVFKPAVAVPPGFSYHQWDVTWTSEYALIPGDVPMVIDLKSLALVPFRIPLPKGGAR